jgi:hypothetical protein
MIDVIVIAFCELVGNWRMGTAIGLGPINVSNVPFTVSSASGLLCRNGAPLFFTCIDYVVLL